MHIDLTNFLAFSTSLGGETLTTIDEGVPFSVVATRTDGLRFTVAGTLKNSPDAGVSRETRIKIGSFLTRYSEIHSFTPSDYKLLTWNASYLLSLVKLYEERAVDSPLVPLVELEDKFVAQMHASSLLSDDELGRRALSAPLLPSTVRTTTVSYVRDPNVAMYVLRNAKGRCQDCDALAPFRRKRNGEPYLEVHHKIRLADGGQDTIQNAVALCPNCHRKAHFGMIENFDTSEANSE